jgi:hypothetical protein
MADPVPFATLFDAGRPARPSLSVDVRKTRTTSGEVREWRWIPIRDRRSDQTQMEMPFVVNSRTAETGLPREFIRIRLKDDGDPTHSNTLQSSTSLLTLPQHRKKPKSFVNSSSMSHTPFLPAGPNLTHLARQPHVMISQSPWATHPAESNLQLITWRDYALHGMLHDGENRADSHTRSEKIQLTSAPMRIGAVRKVWYPREQQSRLSTSMPLLRPAGHHD